MNTIILISLFALTLWALHISSCREGRDSKGKWTKRARKQPFSFSLPRFVPIKYLGKVIGFITL